MLLLAAETVADCCVSPDHMLSTECIATSQVDSGLLSLSRDNATGVAITLAPNVRASPSVLKLNANRVVEVAASSTTTDMSTPCGASFIDSGSSCAGDSDATTPVPEPADEADHSVGLLESPSILPQSVALSNHVAPFAAKRFSSPGCAITFERDVLHNIVSFMNWREAVSIRGVSRHWFEASLTRAVVSRLPSARVPAVFIPCLQEFVHGEAETEARLSRCPQFQAALSDAAPWICEACGWQNPSVAEAAGQEDMALCGNRNCHSVAPSVTKELGSVSRVFLGQLRREGTVPLVEWLFREVLLVPQALMMVENHRHRATGRGKGCAWAYVRHEPVSSSTSCNARDVLMSYHRRLFFDVQRGVEGAWIVHPDHTAALAHDIEARAYNRDRPRLLPRNALVTELPVAQQQSAAPVARHDEMHAAVYEEDVSMYYSPAQMAPYASSQTAMFAPVPRNHHSRYPRVHTPYSSVSSVYVTPLAPSRGASLPQEQQFRPTVRVHNPYQPLVFGYSRN